MLELSNAQIGAWVSSFLLPLFRIAAMLMVMPVFGTQLVPMRIRLYLGVAMTLVLVPHLPAMPDVEALSLSMALLIAEQILIGAMMGFILQLLFQIFTIAGQIIAMQMGLAFASMVDPASGVSVPVIGQFLVLVVTLLFLAMGGHLVAFEVMAESFTTLPVGEALLVERYGDVVGKLSWVFGAGLLISLPMITALLVVNIAFGVMTRAAPQLNIFSIGFPMTLVLGMVIFWLGLSDFLAHFQSICSYALMQLRDFAAVP